MTPADDLLAQLAELRRLSNEATPGPWEAEEVDWEDGNRTFEVSSGARVSPDAFEPHYGCLFTIDDAENGKARTDAALITALRNATDLLARVERVVERCRGAAEAKDSTKGLSVPTVHAVGRFAESLLAILTAEEERDDDD